MSFLNQSEGFTKMVPSLVAVVGYMVAFYALGFTLKP